MGGSIVNPSLTSMENEESSFGYEWTIQDIYLLYHCVCETIRMWPGAPARPAEEQEHLRILRDELYKGVLDYKFHHMDVDEK